MNLKKHRLLLENLDLDLMINLDHFLFRYFL